VNKELQQLFMSDNLPSVKEAVDRLEIALLKEEQVDCPVYHHFSPGLYVREVNVPAGVLAIGHYQKTEHLNIFLKGKVSILQDDGSMQTLIAPMLFTSKPGRKCGYIHEDMVWLNVYPTDETNVEKLEDTYLDKSQGFLQSQADGLMRFVDQESYVEYLKANDGVDIFDIKKWLIAAPGTYTIATYSSKIHGEGLFASAPFKSTDFIAVAMVGDEFTAAARFMNHSANPNSKVIKEGDKLLFIAISDINGMKGGKRGDEITVDYNQFLREVRKCQV
jgi:hypothetical protein